MKQIRFALGLLCLLAAGAASAQSGKVEVQWLGNAAMKITTLGGKVIVIDPYLTANPKTPEQYKKLEGLGKVDLILVSHAHQDHLGDAPALSKLNNAPIWGPGGLSRSLAALGMVPPELANVLRKGGSVSPWSGVKITATHAEHESELVWRNPATNKDEIHVGGEPEGFIIELENGFKIYHMGDTGVFSDMKLIAEYYRPDLIMIPIGGGPYVMNPVDAAYATNQLIRPKFAIPMHYATNPFLKGTPQEYIQALGYTATTVFPINPGDKLQF
jgi:L-ascorbate metabolism protein UlaG (beta-lactamase superfamily)